MNSLDKLIKNYLEETNTKKEKWRVEKTSSILDVWFVSEKYEALFIFTYEDKEKIQLTNIDRSIQGPRRQGYGTKALKTIENTLQEIGKIKNKDVIMHFEVIENQKDTKKWLIKNNYELKNNHKLKNNIYTKTIYLKNNN